MTKYKAFSGYSNKWHYDVQLEIWDDGTEVVLTREIDPIRGTYIGLIDAYGKPLTSKDLVPYEESEAE